MQNTVINLDSEDHYALQSGLCALQEWSDKGLISYMLGNAKLYIIVAIVIIIMRTIMYCVAF